MTKVFTMSSQATCVFCPDCGQEFEHSEQENFYSEESCPVTCPCRSINLGKRKELIKSYMIKSGEEMKKLQNTLEEYTNKMEKGFVILNGLSEATEGIKSQIADCARTQRNIIENFTIQSSRLDLEFDVEERMNSAQAEQALQSIQNKLLADILKKESKSMLHLFTP